MPSCGEQTRLFCYVMSSQFNDYEKISMFKYNA